MSVAVEHPVVGESMLVCPETAIPCNLTEFYCHHGGVCCRRELSNFFCACPERYDGNDCSEDNTLLALLESRDAYNKSMKMIGLSSGISIFVGLIALFSLGVITFIVVRSSRKRRYWGLEPVDPEKDLDKTIVYVQAEISKLSTVQQLNKLHRLSKLFEKTVREAILSEPGHRIERPKSVAMNDYLPRWSSAPSCLNRPPNDLDMPDGGPEDLEDDVFKTTRPRLQQVFSLQ